MDVESIVKILKQKKNPKNVEGMRRFGICVNNTLGVSMPELREMGKEIKRSFGRLGRPQDDMGVALHKLALELWGTGIHEAKILAGIIDLPKMATKSQADKWVRDFDSWDVCDQVCMNLFDKTDWAFEKACEWAKNKNEFVKRAGFALMASLAFHSKTAKDSDFIAFFPFIKEGSIDERNFVKKAVNWALRQIGKRNKSLNKEAIKLAKEIQAAASLRDNKAAKWITNDALRELQSEAVQKRLK